MKEFIVSLLFLAFLVLFANPFMIWMPDAAAMALVGALVVVFSVFVFFLWKEAARDEREALHQMRADRLAYLAGSAVLVATIAAETIMMHRVDPVLLVALGVMIVAKVISHVVSKRSN